jgi:hypothetical protein
MDLTEVGGLLNPDPLRLEMGIERLPSGVLHIAARTDMHNCKGKMFTWWFGWGPKTQHYAWWHPGDHFSSAWENWKPGTYIGAIHAVTEKLAKVEAQALRIQFRDPVEFFDAKELAAAYKSGAVSAVVCGRAGFGENPPHDQEGRILGGRMFHVVRDTPFGCVLRSHFFMLEDFPSNPIPDEVGLNLMKHDYTEYTFLSRFLPSLFYAERRDEEPVPLPW